MDATEKQRNRESEQDSWLIKLAEATWENPDWLAEQMEWFLTRDDALASEGAGEASEVIEQDRDPEWFCLDCKVDTGANQQYYMLKDAVWLAANPQRVGMLCLECVERRLGRELNRDDFADFPINRLQAPKCPELVLRLMRVGIKRI